MQPPDLEPQILAMLPGLQSAPGLGMRTPNGVRGAGERMLDCCRASILAQLVPGKC